MTDMISSTPGLPSCDATVAHAHLPAKGLDLSLTPSALWDRDSFDVVANPMPTPSHIATATVRLPSPSA